MRIKDVNLKDVGIDKGHLVATLELVIGEGESPNPSDFSATAVLTLALTAFSFLLKLLKF